MLLAAKRPDADGASSLGSATAGPATSHVPRSEGHVRIEFKRRDARTVLERFYQSGNLRARISRAEPGHCTEAVFLNTAGGLTGGDRLSLSVRWQAGTHAAVTTQACEKVYRAADGVARVAATLEVEHGAIAEWLPQETILFDRAALDRDLQIRLAVGAVFTGVEAIVLGRAAMGETVRRARLRDGWRIWRGNRLLYADALTMDGDIPPLLAHAAVAGGRTTFATLLHVGASAEAMLEPVRALLATEVGDECAAASAWDGLLAIRIVARNGAILRRAVIRVLDALRAGRALPRVWQI